MSGTGFEQLMADLLLRIIPNPIIWGILYAILLAILLKLFAQPASVGALLFSMCMIVLFNYLGGIFTFFNLLILAGLAVSMIWGLRRAPAG